MAWQYAAMAGYQIVSGLHQAEMVGMQMEVQKEIDEFNAQMAEYDAWKAIGFGQTQMARYQSQIDQAMAAGKASAAAEGVSTTEGSVSEIMADQKFAGFLNMMDIENQARERALGYQRQASNIRMGSKFTQAQGKTQQAAIVGGSVMRAAGTALSGYGGGSETPKGAESGYSISNPGSVAMGSKWQPMAGGYLAEPQEQSYTGYLMP